MREWAIRFGFSLLGTAMFVACCVWVLWPGPEPTYADPAEMDAWTNRQMFGGALVVTALSAPDRPPEHLYPGPHP